MGKIPTVDEARELVNKYNKDEFHRKHAETVSGVMGEFAKEFDPENVEYWAAVGMLHDIDFELYPEQHCVKCVEILKDEGIDDGIIDSVRCHGYGLCEGVERAPEKQMEKVLFAVDELTGLIGACAMVRPSKSVMDMEPSSVKKKFKQPSFAAGCSRDVITKGAEDLGMPLDELISKTLEAMKAIN